MCSAPHDANSSRGKITPDETPLLSKAATCEIQAIVLSLLYYARAIDSTLIPALNTLLYQPVRLCSNVPRCYRLL